MTLIISRPTGGQLLMLSSSIVTSGLVMNLDAAQTASYPGSGTTWTDLSGRGNTGTLTNGPTYSSDNLGSIAFDGTDDSVDLSASSSLTFGSGNFSIDLYLKISTIKSNQYFFDFGANSFVLQYFNNSGTYTLRYLTQATSIKDTTYTLVQNQIYNFCVVRNSGNGYLFLNGSQINSWVDSETYTSNTLKIGKYGLSNAANLNGNVYTFKAYNRALSAAEVSQNFNALRGRYGI